MLGLGELLNPRFRTIGGLIWTGLKLRPVPCCVACPFSVPELLNVRPLLLCCRKPEPLFCCGAAAVGAAAGAALLPRTLFVRSTPLRFALVEGSKRRHPPFVCAFDCAFCGAFAWGAAFRVLAPRSANTPRSRAEAALLTEPLLALPVPLLANPPLLFPFKFAFCRFCAKLANWVFCWRPARADVSVPGDRSEN